MVVVGTAKRRSSATMLGIIAGTVFDVVLRAILLPLAMDPDFAMAMHTPDLGSVIDQPHLARGPATLSLSALCLNENLRLAFIHSTSCHSCLREHELRARVRDEVIRATRRGRAYTRSTRVPT